MYIYQCRPPSCHLFPPESRQTGAPCALNSHHWIRGASGGLEWQMVYMSISQRIIGGSCYISWRRGNTNLNCSFCPLNCSQMKQGTNKWIYLIIYRASTHMGITFAMAKIQRRDNNLKAPFWWDGVCSCCFKQLCRAQYPVNLIPQTC